MVHYNDYANKMPFIEECEPSFAYMKLVQDDFCFLIDVRSKPEWSFVGVPDSKDMKNEVIFCEWAFYPLMDKNLNFENEIFSKLNFGMKRRFLGMKSGFPDPPEPSQPQKTLKNSKPEAWC